MPCARFLVIWYLPLIRLYASPLYLIHICRIMDVQTASSASQTVYGRFMFEICRIMDVQTASSASRTVYGRFMFEIGELCQDSAPQPRCSSGFQLCSSAMSARANLPSMASHARLLLSLQSLWTLRFMACIAPRQGSLPDGSMYNAVVLLCKAVRDAAARAALILEEGRQSMCRLHSHAFVHFGGEILGAGMARGLGSCVGALWCARDSSLTGVFLHEEETGEHIIQSVQDIAVFELFVGCAC